MSKVFFRGICTRGGSYWWRQAVMVALTIIPIKTSQMVSFGGTEAFLIVPPIGLGLGLMLLWGVRQTWLGIVVGAVGASLPDMIEFYGPIRGLIVEIAAVAAMVIPLALFVLWFRRSPARADPLSSVGGVLQLVIVGGVLTYGVNAVLQGTTFWLAGSVPAGYGSILLNFWIMSVIGTARFTAFCLAWRHPWPIERPWLVAGVAVASALLGWAVFWLPTERFAYLEYLTVLLVIWASFTLGQRGATLSVVILSGVLSWATGTGRGPYADLPTHTVLNLTNLYTISVALTGLVVAAVLQERAKASEETRQLNQELELRVAQRTAALEQSNKELEQSNQELEQSNKELEQSNKELEAFSYSVSHDLRTPLRHIGGFASILKEEYKNTLDAEGQRYLEVVCQSAARMGRLIDDLLAFSRMARREMGLEMVDMTALVQEVFSELREESPERKIDLAVGDLPVAVCDRAMVRQVLNNLLSNAIKFTVERPAAVIQVSCMVEEAEQVYSVDDDGAGFDMRYADKLFGVFQRLHPTKQFEGTGIGLAIVRQIVERHGGRVWAEGRPQQGATFHFTLPEQDVLPEQNVPTVTEHNQHRTSRV